jgi:hypothetical protein
LIHDTRCHFWLVAESLTTGKDYPVASLKAIHKLCHCDSWIRLVAKHKNGEQHAPGQHVVPFVLGLMALKRLRF